jgi:hypothetical protein
VNTLVGYCPSVVVYGGPHRMVLELAMLLYGALVFTLITHSALRGRWLLAMVGVWLASAIPLALLATLVEQRSLRPLIGGSWALTFGDPMVLPALFALAALAWRRLTDLNVWYRRTWHGVSIWLVASIILGCALAAYFHHTQALVYDVLRYNSLTKLLHDFVSYPVLWSAGIFLVVPVLLNPRKVGKWLWVLVLLMVLLMVAVLAHETLYPLSTALYHPQADLAEWGRALTCYVRAPMAG